MSRFYIFLLLIFALAMDSRNSFAGCIESHRPATTISACEMNVVSKAKLRQDLKQQVKQKNYFKKTQMLASNQYASTQADATSTNKTYYFAGLLLIFACGLHRILLGSKLSVALQYTLLNFFMGLGALLGLVDITSMLIKGTTEPYEKNNKLFAVWDMF